MKNLTLGLAGITFLAALCTGYDAKIKQDDYFNFRKQICCSQEVANDFHSIAKRLQEARSMLAYKPENEAADRYPDAGTAREQIQIAQWELMGFLGNDPLNDKLTFVYYALPEQNNITTYQGKAADNSAFEHEKKQIDDVIKDLSGIENRFRKAEELELRKNFKLQEFIAGYLISSALIGAAGCLVYMNKRRQQE